MLFLEINALPWKGREVSSFPSVLTNTIADVAIETYQYDGGAINIAVEDRAAADRVVAAVNMAVGSVAYAVSSVDGDVLTVSRIAVEINRPAQFFDVSVARPAEQPAQPAPAVVPITPAVQPAPMAQPVQPAIQYPVVVARKNEVNPQIRNVSQVLNRNAVRDEDLEKHLYSLKNSTASSQITDLNRRLEEYRQYVTAMAAVMRKINELSALTTGDESVKSVIQQIRQITQNMPDNKIEDVFITENYIVFKTVALHALDSRSNQRHNIGRIAIVVPIGTMIGADTTPLHFQPLDFVMKNGPGDNQTTYLLPHVSGSGNYCYGNATEAFIEAVVKRDLICLVDVAIRFLENPNVGDGMGVIIRSWPKVEA